MQVASNHDSLANLKWYAVVHAQANIIKGQHLMFSHQEGSNLPARLYQFFSCTELLDEFVISKGVVELLKYLL